MCAEATDNIKNHTSVLPLTLTLYRREKELSGSCFRPLRLEINHTEQTFSRGETVANRLQYQWLKGRPTERQRSIFRYHAGKSPC